LRHAVLGAGGVGGLLAAALARAGEDVVVLMRGEALRRYSGHLHVHSVVLGTFTTDVEGAAMLDDPVDVLWVTTKSTGLDESLAAAPPEAVGSALVVPLLNGLDHVTRLRRDYDRVSAAAIRVETERTAPGRIRQVSPFLTVEVAPHRDTPAGRAVVDEVATVLTAAGIPATVRDDELGVLWDKFALLAPVALATTGLDAPLGAVREDARYAGCQEEVFALALRDGASTDPEAVRRMVRAAPEEMRSSMQKDVEQGRTPELDAIAGGILRRAASYEVPIPCTEALIALILKRLGTVSGGG
jgi:2-dehydropantoate 2-reductase